MTLRTAPLLRPTRRVLLSAAPAALVLLAGCGFALRRAANYPFKSIAVVGSGLLPATIRRELKGQGTVTVLDESASPLGAEVACQILEQTRGSGIAASTSGGEIRELTLSLTVRYKLVRVSDRQELIGDTTVRQSRDISYNETSALAKENEQELLYRDMSTDIAQQIVRQIGFLK